MAEKKDKKTIQYGEMNQLYDNQDVIETVDMSEQNFVSLSRKAIKDNLVNSDMLQGRRLGFVLQKIKPEKEGFFDSLFSKPLVKYYVRIPELDAHLPQPKTLGEAAKKTLKNTVDGDPLSDQEIIELHEIYEPKSEDSSLSSLVAGDRVWVTGANGKNVILESLKSPPNTSGGKEGDVPNAKTKGSSFRGGSGTGGSFKGRISLKTEQLHPTLAGEKELPVDTAREIASLLNTGGEFSEKAIANILAMIHVDSGFKPSSEMNFEKATLTMTKQHWGARLNPLTDEQIEELKKDYVKFYDYVYYGPTRPGADSVEGEGGHDFRGRGYVHIPGKQFYKKIAEFVPSTADSKDSLLEHENAMMAVVAYYAFVVPEGKRDYEDFSKVYKITKGWIPSEMRETPSKEYYQKDFEKRKKLTEAWLDYVKRNITFSIKSSEFQVAAGGPMEVGSEEMKLATEAHNSFLASYLEAAPQLKRNSAVPMPDPTTKQVDLEEVELSQLIQFPICSNGYNFIAPLQGIPDYGSEFLGVRGNGNHLALDQFVPDSNMTTKIRAIGPGKVTAICHSTTYDNYCKQFQDLMRQHFYGKPGEADKAAEWRISKGYPVPASMLKAWKDHAQVTLPSNYGQMGWEELRTWMNSHVPNNSTKFGANFLRYMRATYGSFMHAGGASVTITYDPDHNGIVYTQYSCHMGEQYVNLNDRVEQGQVIGLIGLTAIFDKNCKHLHFQMESFENGSPIITGYGHVSWKPKNRLNPREIIPALSINRAKTEIKYEGIYSPTGTHASKQKSRIIPTTTTEDSTIVSSTNYPALEPYTENRVRISQGYEEIRDSNDSRLIEVPTVPGRATQKLHYLAATRLLVLIADAATAGFPDVRIASGWRRQRFTSREHYEQEMKRQYPNKTLAEARRLVAYQSPHMTGLAIDFGNNGLEPRSATIAQQKETDFFKWLKANAHYYGLTPYKYEPWHWEVKVPLDAYASGQEFTENYQVFVS